ncbi:glycolate oxidase subunit GlcE [Enterovirga rhinocerotis]|uniref:Glycolate oxidase FAD binding subunit n=1 Tax=Enterovirga rhinocerotis TaxID=1339210 RepID=A0A4R7BW73_9HYPH|nr:glycolate oxidase subunit GlcE [Enterovirga rhinocerotis]TDR90104.1 glycolate oxidase FAD binding subunit [Enterovirga rhinocerotis]
MTLLTPTTEAEACEAVAAAAASGTPLAVEGSGTKAAIGRPIQTERTLTARGLSGITLYEPAEMVIAARAGTPLAEIQRALDLRGQALTFEPMDHRPLLGTAGEPTIGAIAAANISGPRRIQAGAARDSLIGIRIVNGRGEAIKSGGRVMKNVTGLDLVKFVSGSWGTLGFLTEVTFKVLPKPERAATLVLRGLDDARAIAALSAALGSPYDVTGAAHLPAGLGGGGQTLIRVEGLSFSVDHRAGELRRLFRRETSADLIEGEGAAALWRSVRDVEPLVEPRNAAIWRVSTAPTRGPELAGVVGRLLPGSRWFFDWGGGLVWISCPAEGDAGTAAIRAAIDQYGGHATLIRAPAEIRAAIDVFQPQAEPLHKLSVALKASFDPKGLFNPGRMWAGV